MSRPRARTPNDDLFGQADQAGDVGGPEERVDDRLQAVRHDER